MRPLSIYCHEDKLVQEALRRILEAVFEPMFYDEMMGFRPNRGCHKAIRKLNLMLERKQQIMYWMQTLKVFQKGMWGRKGMWVRPYEIPIK